MLLNTERSALVLRRMRKSGKVRSSSILKKFGAQIAYTVDGGALGELEYENFNAATATITIKGVSVHTGSAKNQMINAAAVGCEFQSLLPEKEQPVYTEGYEGFYHLSSIEGSCEHCEIKYLLREHDAEKNLLPRKGKWKKLAGS